MKNSSLSVVFFLLTLVLTLLSWVGSIYGLGEVQSLLSADGIRWMLGHVVENYVQCPALGVVLILLMGVGIAVRSGLSGVLKRLCRKERQLSRKERRALSLALGVGFAYLLLVLLALWLPWNFLLGVTGSWTHSPFSKGMVYVFSIGIGLSGMAYGYVSDTFRQVGDVVAGMSCLISRSASYFVTLFFVVQFFSSLEYVHVADWMGVDGTWVEVVYQLFCYLPLFLLGRKT